LKYPYSLPITHFATALLQATLADQAQSNVPSLLFSWYRPNAAFDAVLFTTNPARPDAHRLRLTNSSAVTYPLADP
ncbi:hypothetical protein, partial [Pseudomonas graminis]|uniref:hypothetical protein n=1 Tax=Pseudomonas graminis TaxID=158627 RepID=UPI003C134BEF